MRQSIVAAAAAALLLAGAPVAAQTAGAFMANPAFADPPPATCDSTFDMEHCAAHDLRVADGQMSRAYVAARARSSAAARQRLLVAQRRWLAARDKGCMAKRAAYAGGTLGPVAVAQCWVTVTQARTKALRVF